MKIIFVRHGKPDYSISDERKLPYALKNYCPLAREGIAKVEETAADPRLKGAEIILVSPYARAMQTAEIINRRLRLTLFVEYDLREWDVAQDFREYVSEPEALRRYREFKTGSGVPPVGAEGLYETGESVRARALSVLQRYRQYKKIIVVAHGTVTRCVAGDVNLDFAGIVEYEM